MDGERILSIKQTMEILGGMSRAQLYRLRCDPKAGLPAMVEISSGRSGFVFSEVLDFIKSRPRRNETNAGRERREQTRRAGQVSAQRRASGK